VLPEHVETEFERVMQVVFPQAEGRKGAGRP
jgi:hypothetical protein